MSHTIDNRVLANKNVSQNYFTFSFLDAVPPVAGARFPVGLQSACLG